MDSWSKWVRSFWTLLCTREGRWKAGVHCVGGGKCPHNRLCVCTLPGNLVEVQIRSALACQGPRAWLSSKLQMTKCCCCFLGVRKPHTAQASAYSVNAGPVWSNSKGMRHQWQAVDSVLPTSSSIPKCLLIKTVEFLWKYFKANALAWWAPICHLQRLPKSL